jgi:hypothetical protein
MMVKRFSAWLWVLALVVALAAGLNSCGGGGGTTSGNSGTIDTGGGRPDPLIISGPSQYGGQQLDPPPPIPDTTPVPTDAGWDVGSNIFSVPIDTNGTGRVVASHFDPGRKVAFVAVNLNPLFLDAHLVGGIFPGLPTSSYTLQADLIQKGASSMTPWSEITEATQADLGSLDAYQGMPYKGELQNPLKIYEREAEASGRVAYAADAPTKSASLIQKGEIRTFLNIPPTIPPPPVLPGETNDTDPATLSYPYEYVNATDARLVAIGAHCLIFLTREINDGVPDTIQFTEDRLTRMAREFDTNIYQTETTSLGPVDNYLEGNVLLDIDRGVRLTADDFNKNGSLAIALPGRVDTDISKEKKIILVIFKGSGPGGFFSWGLNDAARQLLASEGRSDEISALEDVGSTLYIDAANFPANDNGWTSAYSIMAHEFQHKLNKDNNLPKREVDRYAGNYSWFNEGMSQLAIHLCGYTVNSGRIVPWLIDGQLTDYLTRTNTSAIPMDGNKYMDGDVQQSGTDQQTQYGNGFLFFLYLYEHYGAGVGKKIYDRAKSGETNYIRLIEYATGEEFSLTYSKFMIANFIDGIYSIEDSPVVVLDFNAAVPGDEIQLFGHGDPGHVGTDLEVYYSPVVLESPSDPNWVPLWTSNYANDHQLFSFPVSIRQLKLVHRQKVQGWQDTLDAIGVRMAGAETYTFPNVVSYDHNWVNPEWLTGANDGQAATTNNKSAFDPRFRYNTIDLKGTVNLASGTMVLPGVRTQTYPSGGSYPVQDIHRLVYPWCSDYLVLTNGDGRDLEVTFHLDRNFKIFMLPVEFDKALNAVRITPEVSID